MGGDLSRVKAESELEKYIRTDDDEALPGVMHSRYANITRTPILVLLANSKTCVQAG